MSALRGKEQSVTYLVGTVDRWNDAKREEERDRVKHTNADDPIGFGD